MRALLLALLLAGCAPGEADLPLAPAPPPEAPLVGTVWRLTALGGDAPADGVRPALVFTEASGETDMYDRPRAPEWAGSLLLRGESGVGPLHEPYFLTGDSLRIGAEYNYTRLSPEASIDQARAFMDALASTRRLWRDGQHLALLGAEADTLARFAADPPRPPGPLDDIEWVAARVDGGAVPDSVRMTITFSSTPLGPGPDDGFDQVGGYDGCNWYGGGYRLAEQGAGTLRLTTNGPFMSTARGCMPSVLDLSTAFSTALFEARTVRFEGDRLALVDSSGAERAAFRRHVPYAVQPGELTRGRWRYASASNPHALDGSGAVLTFADSTFTGRNGCQAIRGRYAVRGDDLVIPETRSDGECSPEEAQEAGYVPIQSGKLAVSRDTLTLYDENGRRTVYVRPD